MLAGARSIAAIAEWAADTPQQARAALGVRHHTPGHLAVPAEATIRRTLAHLDADALAAAVGAWLADQDRERPAPAASRRRAVAVDGKTLRGARGAGDGRPAHLLAAMDHTSRAVLAQHQVGGAPEEVPAFQPLLAPLDLAGGDRPQAGIGPVGVHAQQQPLGQHLRVQVGAAGDRGDRAAGSRCAAPPP